MDLVKLEIDGKRIIADNRQTILEVARQNGIDSIPDPLPRRAARAVRVLLPVRGEGQGSAHAAAGLLHEGLGRHGRRDRHARGAPVAQGGAGADAVEPLRRLHRSVPARVPGRDRHPGLHRPGRARASTRTRSRSSRRRNPLPAICGRVCTRPCEVNGCRRNLLDEAVGIDYIKRYVADLDLGATESCRPGPAPPNGKKVAVVGAGPAGLSAPTTWPSRGYAVHIFESQPEAGGMLRYGIPEYRLPKEILDLEVNQILDLGVRLSTNVTLGKDFTIASLKQDGYDAVFLGIGAWDSSKMRVQNENAAGVLPGIEFLQELRPAQARSTSTARCSSSAAATPRSTARARRCASARPRCACSTAAPGTRCRPTRWRSSRRDHEGVDMDFLVAPVRVIKDGRAGDGSRVPHAWSSASRTRAGAAARSRSAGPSSSSRLRLRDRRDRPGHEGPGARRRPGPELPPLRGGAEPHPLADDPGQREDLRDERRGGLLGRRRGDRRGDRDRGDRGRAQGRARNRHLHPHGQGPARAVSSSSAARTPSARSPSRTCGTAPATRAAPMPACPLEERVKGFVEVEQGYTAERRAARERAAASSAAASRSSTATCVATRPSTRSTSPHFLGEAKQHRIDRTPSADRTRPEQVHPLRPLRPDLQRGRGRGGLRLHQPRLQHGRHARRWADRCSTPTASAAGCASAPARPARSRTDRRSPSRVRGRPSQTPTVCHYCGVGCRLNYDTFGDSLRRRCRATTTNEVTCRQPLPKGRFGLRLRAGAGAAASAG